MFLKGSPSCATILLNMEAIPTGSILIYLNLHYVSSSNYAIDICAYMHRIYLMGQSAGAHISACALLNQAIKESKEGDVMSWSVSQIKAYFGLSGG